MKIRKQRTNKLKIVAPLLIVLAIVGGYFYYSTYVAQPPSPLLAPVQTQRSPENVDAPPQETQKFAALSEVPTRLVIEKIGVDAAIEPVGLTEEGMLDAPQTNEGVGWYSESARAGESEFAMLLDGHYGIGDRPGVFRRLQELRVDDILEVRGEAGAVLQYKVVEMAAQQYIEEVDMRKALYPYREGVQSLTIITCEGEYDSTQETYDKRTVLYAERIL